jgi:hypothetical protein
MLLSVGEADATNGDTLAQGRGDVKRDAVPYGVVPGLAAMQE